MINTRSGAKRFLFGPMVGAFLATLGIAALEIRLRWFKALGLLSEAA